VATLVAYHENVWLVLSYDQGYQKDIKSYFDNHYQQIGLMSFSPGLAVYGYKVHYP
jgi:mannosyltransferase